jgi:hypothetical protein
MYSDLNQAIGYIEGEISGILDQKKDYNLSEEYFEFLDNGP